jgi:hypothetical protein
MALPQSDTFFLGVATRIRWSIQDKNRNEIARIDHEFNLNRICRVLVGLGYLTKRESRLAKFYRPTI